MLDSLNVRTNLLSLLYQINVAKSIFSYNINGNFFKIFIIIINSIFFNINVSIEKHGVNKIKVDYFFLRFYKKSEYDSNRTVPQK